MLTFWRKRDWLYRWALAALAESGAAIPWLLFFYSSGQPKGWEPAVPGPWLLVLTYMAGGLWEAGVKKAKDNPWRRILTMVPAVLVAYLIAYAVLPVSLREGLFQPNLALAYLPVSAYLWFQGTKGAAEGIEYDRVFVRFMWQIISQIVAVTLLILTRVVAGGTVNLLLYWSVLLLFGSGLLLLVVTRDRTLRQGQAKLGDEARGSSGTVSRALAGIVIGLVVVTVVAAQLLSTDSLMALGRAIWHLLDRPIGWLLDVIFLLLHRLIMLMALVISALVQLYYATMGREKPGPPGEDVQLGLPADQLRQPTHSWDAAAPYIKGLLVVAMVAAVALLLYRVTSKIESSEAEEEERVSLGFWASLMADVKGLFGGAAVAATAAAVAQLTEWLDPRDPRSLYRRFQVYGEGLGRPRGPAETPNAYRQLLSGAKPEAEPAARLVTGIYNQARYGAEAPTADEIERAAQALNHAAGPSPD